VVTTRRGSVPCVGPSSAAAGPVETALGLVLAQAAPAQPLAWQVLGAHLLGVDGGPPLPAPAVAAEAGVRLSWLRGLLTRVRMVARHAGPPTSVVQGMRLLEGGPVRTLEEARSALVTAGVSSSGVHPGGVLRVAEVLGPGCRAQLVEAGGVVVVAPAGRVALEGAVRAAAAEAVRRVDVAPLAAVAATVGAPVAVAAAVLGRDRRWVVHEADDGVWWCWRSGARPGQRHLVASTVVRLLAVRGYEAAELREAAVEALTRLPPSTRGDLNVDAVAPAGVLVAWLASSTLLVPELTGNAAGSTPRLLRCAPKAGVASDLMMAGAVAAAGRPVSTAELAVVLREAGYAPSSATQLARSSPVLRRVGRDAYVLR